MSFNSNSQNHHIDSSESNGEERKRFNITESIITSQIPNNEMKNDYSKPWPSLDKYLKVMTNLTLESFFRPLRFYLDQLKNNQLDPRDLYLYKNVFVSPLYFIKGNIEHDLYIQFDIRGPTYSEDGEIKEYDWKVDWEHTERLKKRSLLIFSQSQFMDTIDAVAFSCAEQGSIINNKVEILLLQGKLELSQVYYMFEPTSYWNQVIIDNLLNTSESTIPKWIMKPFLQFDFSRSKIVTKINAPDIEDTDFDEEQFRPFQYCLNNRLTLVNGAPGTGKSYLGRELVKFLIKSGYEYPIMVVTYKNISLDSFLEKMSGFLFREKVDFIRIGGILKTKNGLIKKNDYIPRTPKHIQEMKRKLMFVNSLIINTNNCILWELKNKTFNDFTVIILDEIDKIINIRKMLSDKYPLYTKYDELLIKYFFDPNEFIPSAKDYFCFYANDRYFQQFKEKLFQRCNDIIKQFKIYYNEKGQGTYNKDIKRIIEDHFSNDSNEFYNFLSDQKDLLFPVNEDSSNQNFCILHRIIEQSNFVADELKIVDDEEKLLDMELETSFINYIQNLFEGMTKKHFSYDELYAFMTDLQRFLMYTKTNLEQKIFDKTKEYEREETERLSIELSHKKLIAITATRAAQFKESLDRSNCKFVIVEEAGELTEPITFSIFPKTTAQIVMIGDYNQLRPKVYQEMAKDPFNHHISLFEKVVRKAKDNKFPLLFTLSIQRRMHPEISSLIKPVFYNFKKTDERLFDHDDTGYLGLPYGFPNHLQFWLHNFNEKPPDKFERSYSNIEEAKICAHLFLMMLCRGYKSSEITILAAYKGQKKQIIKELVHLIGQYYNDEEMSCFDIFDFENDLTKDIRVANLKIDKRNEFKTLIEIRKNLVHNFVKCLDDFQGGENEVVILSLTRSSEVGFLGERNRSLVALSRAKQMEIVVGNESIFGINCENSLWRYISYQLTKFNRNRLQNGITINACQIHEKSLSMKQVINSLDDLFKYRFNYCTCPCDCPHDCNHQCKLPCHYHKTMRPKVKKLYNRRYYCPEQCQCECNGGHQCQGMCGECKHFGCPQCPQCQQLIDDDDDYNHEDN